MVKRKKLAYVVPIGAVVLIPAALISMLTINESAETMTPRPVLSVQLKQGAGDFALNHVSISEYHPRTTSTDSIDLETALTAYDDQADGAESVIHSINNTQFDFQMLSAQDEIMAAVNETGLDPADLGHLFVPKQPAQATDVREGVHQIDVPLILQKDPKWRSEAYGSNTTKELGENGCAIVVLAMVASYYEDELVTPQDILAWSGEEYYVDNQGTSWNIFHNFAENFDYQFMNYGSNFSEAMTALENDELIVASVAPGFFTEQGHILVIRGYDAEEGLVYVNDPNDDPSKMYSLQGIDEAIFAKDGLNYWALSK